MDHLRRAGSSSKSCRTRDADGRATCNRVCMEAVDLPRRRDDGRAERAESSPAEVLLGRPRVVRLVGGNLQQYIFIDYLVLPECVTSDTGQPEHFTVTPAPPDHRNRMRCCNQLVYTKIQLKLIAIIKIKPPILFRTGPNCNRYIAKLINCTKDFRCSIPKTATALNCYLKSNQHEDCHHSDNCFDQIVTIPTIVLTRLSPFRQLF